MKPISDAEINLVEISEGTPHCKNHGAMNKLTADGIWRCMSTYRIDKSDPKRIRFYENNCRAGGQEE